MIIRAILPYIKGEWIINKDGKFVGSLSDEEACEAYGDCQVLHITSSAYGDPFGKDINYRGSNIQIFI